MMDLATIRELSREAAQVARSERKLPAVPTDIQRALFSTGKFGSFRIPNLGDYVPKGWKLEKQYFVDKSGFGSPGEPALTQDAFAKLIAQSPKGRGFAMIEEGQFQAYVGEFKRVGLSRADLK